MLNEVAFDESPETNVTAPKPFMYDAIATVLFEHALSNFKEAGTKPTSKLKSL